MPSTTESSATRLRNQQADLLDDVEKLTEMSLEDDRTPEEVAELERQASEKMEQAKALDEKIKLMDQLLERKNAGTQPATVNVETVQEKPKRRVTIPAQAKRYLPIQNFVREEVAGMTPEERAYGYGRFFLAVAARNGKYSHLQKYQQAHIDSFGPMNAATEGGQYGVWVPEQFGTDVINLMKKYGLARQILNVLPMTSDKRTDPKEGSDPVPTWVGEGIEGTDVTPTDPQSITLSAKKLMAILINSSELNEDAIAELGDSLMRRTANGFSKAEDDAAFIGDGTSTYGGIVGINTKLLDVDGAATQSAGVTNGAAGTDIAWSGFTLANFENMIGDLPDYADAGPEDAPTAQWVCHRAFYYRVMVALERAAGGTPASEIVDGFRRPLFYGWPVRFSNSYPSTEPGAAVQSIQCTFGDHARAANFGDRRMYSVDFSEQATVGSVNLWSSDQVGFKATERIDIAVHSVGDATDPGPVTGLRTTD